MKTDYRKPKTENRKPHNSTPPHPPLPSHQDWPYLLGLALAGAALFFLHLGVPGLMDPDEGRYAEIAREIWVLGDWLIPHLNLLPYLEKPPLVYWLTALSFGGWGYTAGAARFPAALSALGGVFLAYGLGRALWGRMPGFCSALVLATCGGYIIMGRLLTLDMTLAFFLNLGVGLGYLALSRGRRELWPWAYLALGLAALTKGPVAVVLAGLIWGAWALLQRRPLRPILNPWGLLLLAVLSLPWFAYVAWRYPEFWRFFVLEQHLGRYLAATIHHHEPFYYYLPVLLGFMLPWSWLLPWALGRRGVGTGDRLFLVLWAGIILVFFSLSRGKLAPYILPALLPLSLLLGDGLASLKAGGPGSFGSRELFLSLIIWLLAAWGLAGLYFLPPAFLAPKLVPAGILGPYLPWGLVILALIPALALVRRRVEYFLAGAVMLGLLLPGGMARISSLRSPRELGVVLRSHWQPGAALIGFRLYSQGLSFYSGQVFHLVDFRTELDFGRRLKRDSGLYLANRTELNTLAHSRPQVFFYLKERDYPLLKQQLPIGKFHFLARHRDCLLATYQGK